VTLKKLGAYLREHVIDTSQRPHCFHERVFKIFCPNGGVMRKVLENGVSESFERREKVGRSYSFVHWCWDKEIWHQKAKFTPDPLHKSVGWGSLLNERTRRNDRSQRLEHGNMGAFLALRTESKDLSSALQNI